MKTISKSENSRLFAEAETLKKSIQSEIHCSATNTRDSVTTVQKKSSPSKEMHNKKIQGDR
jgi:hypothetical protein